MGVVKLPNEEVQQMMQSLAVQQFIQQGWEFKLETDSEFITRLDVFFYADSAPPLAGYVAQSPAWELLCGCPPLPPEMMTPAIQDAHRDHVCQRQLSIHSHEPYTSTVQHIQWNLSPWVLLSVHTMGVSGHMSVYFWECCLHVLFAVVFWQIMPFSMNYNTFQCHLSTYL